jgi:acetyltransferase
MCAQIVAPYPPPGRISVASQSGNLVSSFLHYAVLTGIGVSKAISAGNSAQLGLADYLDYFAADPETAVALAYLEGVPDGRRFAEAARALVSRKPLVLLKGGVAAEGKRAAASHTGSLASDDRIFDGVAAQVGALRAPTSSSASGRRASRRARAAKSCSRPLAASSPLTPALPRAQLRAPGRPPPAIGALVPPRWSKSNPVDLAGGETRDTIPQVLDLLCAHPAVDAVVHLGIGIQAAQAEAFRSGPFHPGHGLDRIVEFHERQDRRYAAAAREASERHGSPC